MTIFFNGHAFKYEIEHRIAQMLLYKEQDLSIHVKHKYFPPLATIMKKSPEKNLGRLFSR